MTLISATPDAGEGVKKEYQTPKTTKAQLARNLDQVAELVDEALDPELTREELVAKVKEISEVVNDPEAEPEDEDEDE